MPSIDVSHQLRESAARCLLDTRLPTYRGPRATTRAPTNRYNFFWYKSTDGVNCLATSCSNFSEIPRHVNDYTFSTRRFANYPYPTTFPKDGPWPPRTVQGLLHAPELGDDDCVGSLCYTNDICKDRCCSHTFANWRRATEDWQEYFELRETANHGIGVYTRKAFTQGSTLGWYTGNIIPGDAGHHENAYLMAVPIGIHDGNLDLGSCYAPSSASSVPSSKLSGTVSLVPNEEIVLIDGERVGNWTRFINHSCEPYSEFQIRRVGRMRIMAVVATRDIPEDVEVTVSYGPWYWDSTTGKTCRCGVSNCVSKIGA